MTPFGKMTPMGFEPTTPGLRVQCSDQAELRSHIGLIKMRFIKIVLNVEIIFVSNPIT